MNQPGFGQVARGLTFESFWSGDEPMRAHDIGVRQWVPSAKNLPTEPGYQYFSIYSDSVPLVGGLPPGLRLRKTAREAVFAGNKHMVIGRVREDDPSKIEFLMVGWKDKGKHVLTPQEKALLGKWLIQVGAKPSGFHEDFWLPSEKLREYGAIRLRFRGRLEPVATPTPTQAAFTSKVASGSEKRRGRNIELVGGEPRHAMARESAEVPCITISRRKIKRSPLATGFGFAWRWIYDVTGPDGENIVQGTDRLEIARKQAKERAKELGVPVVLSWEEKGSGGLK